MRPHGDKQLLELMCWTFDVTNRFFSILYHHGIWLPRTAAETAVDLGFAMGDSWNSGHFIKLIKSVTASVEHI